MFLADREGGGENSFLGRTREELHDKHGQLVLLRWVRVLSIARTRIGGWLRVCVLESFRRFEWGRRRNSACVSTRETIRTDGWMNESWASLRVGVNLGEFACWGKFLGKRARVQR
jgi:hypothetical protein